MSYLTRRIMNFCIQFLCLNGEQCSYFNIYQLYLEIAKQRKYKTEQPFFVYIFDNSRANKQN